MQTLMAMQADVGFDSEIDPIEEMKLRTWARRHYTPTEDRDETWHPIVLDEMTRKDREGGDRPNRPR